MYRLEALNRFDTFGKLREQILSGRLFDGVDLLQVDILLFLLLQVSVKFVIEYVLLLFDAHD